MRDLATLSKSELKEFLSSFDLILSDMDGVIYCMFKPFPGVVDCIHLLQEMGKKLHFVTNSCILQPDEYSARLKKMDINVPEENIINPTVAFISYLKSINFTKELFVLGLPKCKESLVKAGFKLADPGPDRVTETIPEVIANIQQNEKVGAVLIDVDVNLNFIKVQKILTYLKRKDVLFLVGAEDLKAPFTPDFILWGPKYIQKTVQEISGRVPVGLAKPSQHYVNLANEKFGVQDPSRVLFIGDSITEDMGFAAEGGYQKLLVLSGLAKRHDVENSWEYDEKTKPHYYVENLGVLHELIKDLETCKIKSNI